MFHVHLRLTSRRATYRRYHRWINRAALIAGDQQGEKEATRLFVIPASSSCPWCDSQRTTTRKWWETSDAQGLHARSEDLRDALLLSSLRCFTHNRGQDNIVKYPKVKPGYQKIKSQVPRS
ncbi:hypothetical protein EYF80_030613 [Liparis tanakae]|uniref:Uncharacterized protein n=1 Tax=Liparis tanakae TaxID=230148 RepID=A0A4Z2H251_9TELE|nr:hypothetical protein EYF80_030613 [Liparis tanakae]